MNCTNSKNLVRCGNCDALYNKIVSWAKGYYEGTSNYFTPIGKVKENCCPVCGKENL